MNSHNETIQTRMGYNLANYYGKKICNDNDNGLNKFLSNVTKLNEENNISTMEVFSSVIFSSPIKMEQISELLNQLHIFLNVHELMNPQKISIILLQNLDKLEAIQDQKITPLCQNMKTFIYKNILDYLENDPQFLINIPEQSPKVEGSQEKDISFEDKQIQKSFTLSYLEQTLVHHRQIIMQGRWERIKEFNEKKPKIYPFLHQIFNILTIMKATLEKDIIENCSDDTVATENQSLSDLLKNKIEKKEKLLEDLEQSLTTLMNQVDSYNEEDASFYKFLKENLEILEKLNLELKELLKSNKNLANETEKPLENLANETEKPLENLANETEKPLEKLSDKIAEIWSRIVRIESRITYFKNTEDCEHIVKASDEILEVQSQIDQLKQEIQILKDLLNNFNKLNKLKINFWNNTNFIQYIIKTYGQANSPKVCNVTLKKLCSDYINSHLDPNNIEIINKIFERAWEIKEACKNSATFNLLTSVNEYIPHDISELISTKLNQCDGEQITLVNTKTAKGVKEELEAQGYQYCDKDSSIHPISFFSRKDELVNNDADQKSQRKQQFDNL